MPGEKKIPLLVICGVYCGACSIYRAYNDNDEALYQRNIDKGISRDQIFCKGCGSNVVNEWYANCDFRKCVKEKEIVYCFECEDSLCKKLVDFSKTRPHRTLGLRNFKQLKEMDIEEWLKQQKKLWTCSQCGKQPQTRRRAKAFLEEIELAGGFLQCLPEGHQGLYFFIGIVELIDH